MKTSVLKKEILLRTAQKFISPTLLCLFVTVFQPAFGDGVPQIENIGIKEEFYSINIEKFKQRLEESLQDVKGFAYVLSHKGIKQAEGAGGFARFDSENEALPFTTQTYTNIGSVAKVITGAAVLQVLDSKNISLDATISAYLPKRWKEVMTTNESNALEITFRQLLGHRTGMRDIDDTYDELRIYLFNGIPQVHIGDYYYSNVNYRLIAILLPLLNANAEALALDQELYQDFLDNMISEEEYDKEIEKGLSLIFEAYIKENIFEPIGVKAGCDIAEYSNGKHALLYLNKNDLMPGGSTENSPVNSDCGSGAVAMPIEGLANFLAHLQYSDKIIDSDIFKETLDLEYIGKSLIWTWKKDPFHFGQGGDLYDYLDRVVHTQAIIYGAYQICIAVNSHIEGGSETLRARVINAIRFATVLNCDGTPPSSHYINRVTINDKTFTTGDNGGYYDGPGNEYNGLECLYTNKTISFTLEPGFKDGVEKPLYWAIYLDVDHDGFFTTKDRIFSADEVMGKAQANVVINGPGKYMIVCNDQPIKDANLFCQGEVEFYYISSIYSDEPIIPNDLWFYLFDYFSNPPPVHLLNINIGGKSFQIDWNADQEALIQMIDEFIDLQFTFELNNVYPFELVAGFQKQYPASLDGMHWKIFLDLNKNGIIEKEAGEVIYSSESSGKKGVFILDDLYIPFTGETGETFLYIGLRDGQPVPDDISCMNSSSKNGQVIKFNVALKSTSSLSPPPLYPLTHDISSTGAVLNWRSSGQNVSYEVGFKEKGMDTWQKLFLTSDTALIVSHLEPESNYEWAVRTKIKYHYNQWSQNVPFTTLSPENCGTDKYDLPPNTPNNNKQHATPLTIGQNIYGLICGDEQDWFTFQINSQIPQNYEFKLSGENGGNLGGKYSMILYKDGEVGWLNDVIVVDNAPQTITKSLTAGTYFIQVLALDGVSQSSYYRLSVQQNIWNIQNQLASDDDDFVVYPNPVVLGENIYLKLDENRGGRPFKLVLYNHFGEKVTGGIYEGPLLRLDQKITKKGLYYLTIEGVDWSDYQIIIIH